MILALDVGNTNIVIGCIDQGKVICDGRLSTNHNNTMDEYAIHFKIFLEMHHIDLKKIDGAIISSVVPSITNSLKTAVQMVIGLMPLQVGPGIKTGLNIRTDFPNQLGADLVVGAVAAIHDFKPPIIIFDLGTATTCSVIDKDLNYLGGLIFPGIKVAADALSSHASQLPYISLEAPKKIVGRNTIDCMKSGIVFGNAAMIDGVIDRIEEELGQKASVIATGGLAQCIVEQCKRTITIDSDLLLKGLWLIYLKNR